MTVFNIETLTAFGARLFDHADSITNPVRRDMEVDCRLAARAPRTSQHCDSASERSLRRPLRSRALLPGAT
jgi:hypothetical protein